MTEERPVILIVDDNPENLNLLIDVLNEREFDIRIAKDGRIALDIVAAEKPDLVLLDIMMPGMNGFEMCSRLKSDRQTRDIPVIFMTVLSDTINKVRGFQIGAADYITKPIQVEEVMARIRAQLDLRKLSRDKKRANRLQSRFITLASHDLRIPLDMISSLTRFLMEAEDSLSSGERRQKLEMIDDAAKKIGAILDELLISMNPENRS